MWIWTGQTTRKKMLAVKIIINLQKSWKYWRRKLPQLRRNFPSLRRNFPYAFFWCFFCTGTCQFISNFGSKTMSSETLIRGAEILRSSTMSLENDPLYKEMMEEKAKLLVPLMHFWTQSLSLGYVFNWDLFHLRATPKNIWLKEKVLGGKVYFSLNVLLHRKGLWCSHTQRSPTSA